MLCSCITWHTDPIKSTNTLSLSYTTVTVYTHSPFHFPLANPWVLSSFIQLFYSAYRMHDIILLICISFFTPFSKSLTRPLPRSNSHINYTHTKALRWLYTPITRQLHAFTPGAPFSQEGKIGFVPTVPEELGRHRKTIEAFYAYFVLLTSLTLSIVNQTAVPTRLIETKL